MAPHIAPVQTSDGLPEATTVVVIGGGIVGLTAALTLAERGVPVVVLEKGRLAAEQSSRNQGWIRKTSRSAADVPLAVVSDQFWADAQRWLGADVGYRQCGIMFLAKTEAEIETHANWIESVRGLDLDSRLLTTREIDSMAPGGRGEWAGAVFSASDGRAEPSLAASAVAAQAMRKGALIIENCAVRTLVRSGGKISGVVTERGEIRCDQVLLAGGLWSRRFLGNHGVALPTLPLILSVIRTTPLAGPTDIAVGGPDFSFRKRLDGGFTVTQRGAVEAPLTLDHLLIGHRYLEALRYQRHFLRVSLGRAFLSDLSLGRRWGEDDVSPFEKVRTIDPPANGAINEEAMQNLRKVWPAFDNAHIAETWAGAMDITPDSMPVIDEVEQIPGLTIASGFSGHGFGTAPGAGRLAADIVIHEPPVVDPAPYALRRFG